MNAGTCDYDHPASEKGTGFKDKGKSKGKNKGKSKGKSNGKQILRGKIQIYWPIDNIEAICGHWSA